MIGERSFMLKNRNPLATSWTSEVHPQIETSHVTDAFKHMRINNLQFSILRVPKHSIFPQLEGHNPPVKEKGGHCEYRGL